MLTTVVMLASLLCIAGLSKLGQLRLDRLSPAEQDELDRLYRKAEGKEFEQMTDGGKETDKVTHFNKPKSGDPNRKWGEAPLGNPTSVNIRGTISAEDWVKKQLDGLRATGAENYRQGVLNPRRDPIKAGIAAQDRYEEQMTKKEVLARRVRGLQGTNADEWAHMAATRGADKLVGGVEARQHKVERAIGELQPKVASISRKIQAMPAKTDQQREARMIANLRAMRDLKKS